MTTDYCLITEFNEKGVSDNYCISQTDNDNNANLTPSCTDNVMKVTDTFNTFEL